MSNQRDDELERLSREMENAQRDIDCAKQRLDYIGSRRDPIKSQIESCKYRIEDIKHSISNERDAARYCSQCGDRIDAQTHRYNADFYRDSLEREYSIKNGLYDDLNAVKSDFDDAVSRLREAKDRKQRAREQFNSRLEYLKNQKAIRDAQWHETRCRVCGGSIRYHSDWAHIPSVCKNCKSK